MRHPSIWSLIYSLYNIISKLGYKDCIASFINLVLNLVFFNKSFQVAKLFFGSFCLLAICTTCRKKHSEELDRKSDWLYHEDTEGDMLLQRYCREGSRLFVVSQKIHTLSCQVILSQGN